MTDGNPAPVRWLFVATVLLAGCANLTVTRVTADNQATVQGVRYYLPKPFLQVTPKPDGSVSVNVIYLPDTGREYAVDTTSLVSSYTFQIARDPLGLLSGIEYKADTTAVGQQVAASAEAAAVQAYNLKGSQLAAVQAQVNTAQAAVDADNATLVAAQAALASDTASFGSTLTTGQQTQLATDNSNAQQAMAKLQAAQQVLKRTQSASQAVSNTIAAATPVPAPGPTVGSALSVPTATLTPYSLPDKFGPVLFAIDEDDSNLSLTAVVSPMKDTGLGSVDELHAGVVGAAQRTFKTVGTALGAPSLTPPNLSVKLSTNQAVFMFSRAVVSLTSDGIQATNDATPSVAAAIPSTPNPLQGDKVTLKLDITHLSAGTYSVTVPFIWAVDSISAHNETCSAQPGSCAAHVKLSVTGP